MEKLFTDYLEFQDEAAQTPESSQRLLFLETQQKKLQQSNKLAN